MLWRMGVGTGGCVGGGGYLLGGGWSFVSGVVRCDLFGQRGVWVFAV